MKHLFTTYEAYLDRYRMFWSEEGDQRPPMLSKDEFSTTFLLLRESYLSYRDLITQGKEEEASIYYLNIIHSLENDLAIADGSDNFGAQDGNVLDEFTSRH